MEGAPDLWVCASTALPSLALLLFPDYPDGPVQGLPGNERNSVEGVWWFSGTRARTGASGVDLVKLVEQRADIMWELNKLDQMLMEIMLTNPKDAKRPRR